MSNGDLICESFDVTLRDTLRPCTDKALMFVTYRDHGSPVSRLLCSYHLDQFLDLVNRSGGAYDPVSLYPAAAASVVRGK